MGTDTAHKTLSLDSGYVKENEVEKEYCGCTTEPTSLLGNARSSRRRPVDEVDVGRTECNLSQVAWPPNIEVNNDICERELRPLPLHIMVQA